MQESPGTKVPGLFLWSGGLLCVSGWVSFFKDRQVDTLPFPANQKTGASTKHTMQSECQPIANSLLDLLSKRQVREFTAAKLACGGSQSIYDRADKSPFIICPRRQIVS
jgi:hypothetical protein